MSTDFFAKKMSRSQFSMSLTQKWSPNRTLHFIFFHRKVNYQGFFRDFLHFSTFSVSKCRKPNQSKQPQNSNLDAPRPLKSLPWHPGSNLKASWSIPRNIEISWFSKIFGTRKNLSSNWNFSQTHRRTQRMHFWIYHDLSYPGKLLPSQTNG